MKVLQLDVSFPWNACSPRVADIKRLLNSIFPHRAEKPAEHWSLEDLSIL